MMVAPGAHVLHPVRIGINAPKDVAGHREEIAGRIKHEFRGAMLTAEAWLFTQ
jgi:sRNA-binding carbon storage regulator CsrA